VATPSSAFVTDMKIDVNSEHVEEIGMTMAADWSKASFVEADKRVLGLDVETSYGSDTTTVQVKATAVNSDEHISGFGHFNSTQPSGAVAAMQVHNMFVGRSTYNLAATGRVDSTENEGEGEDELVRSDYAMMSSSSWATDMSDPDHSTLWQFLQEFDWMGDACLDGDDFSYTHKSEVHYSMAPGTYTALEISMSGFDFDAMTGAERGILRDAVATMVVDHSAGAMTSNDVKEVRLAKQGASGSTRRLRSDDAVTATIILDDSVDTVMATMLADALNEAIKKGDLTISVQVNGEQHTIAITQQVSASIVAMTTTAPPTQGNTADDGLETEVVAAIAAGATALVLALVVAMVVVRSKGSNSKRSRDAQQYDEPPSPARTPTSLRKFRVAPSPTPEDNTACPYDAEEPPQYGLKAVPDTAAAFDDDVTVYSPRQSYLSGARPSQRVNKIAKVSTAASLASLGSSNSSKTSLAELAELSEDDNDSDIPLPPARGTLVAEN